ARTEPANRVSTPSKCGTWEAASRHAWPRPGASWAWSWIRRSSTPTSSARTTGGRGSGPLPAAARRAAHVGARVARVGSESLAHRAWPGREGTHRAAALDDAAGDGGLRRRRTPGERAADSRHRLRRSASPGAGVGGPAKRRAGRRDPPRCAPGRPRVIRPPVRAGVLLQRQPRRAAWILDALARLGARPPRPPHPPLLVSRGSGSLEAAVRTQAERLGVEVQLLGFLPADELAAAYNAASCLVHVCPVETFGLTVAEAMACGRPVVAVASGALPEVVDGVGVLAPPDDPAAFAEAVRALLADPARAAALGAAARDRAVDAFSMERMGREYGEALEALPRSPEPR